MTGSLIQVGCCGFPVKKPEYTQVFSVVEIQQTFYQPPRITTLEKWRDLMPPYFEFVPKAWQLITHTSRSPTFRRLKIKLTPELLELSGGFRNTPPVQHAWETTLAGALAVKARLVLFQCPASFKPEPENLAQLRSFFSTVERNGLKFLWEPRGEWPAELIHSLCHELKLIHVVDPFLAKPLYGDLIYFRLHGGKGFKHVFSDDELQFVRDLIPHNVPAYVMFNNITMWQDAQRFKKLICQA